MRDIADRFLRGSLLDLHARLNEEGIKLILGGGFGLFLKQLDLLSKEASNTLIPAQGWPRPRTTNDLDFFVPLDLLVNLTDMQTVRRVLDELDFQAIAGSEFWQFALPGNKVKVDLLTGPIAEWSKPQLRLDTQYNRRVRPKGDLKLHAHPTPEALGIAENHEAILIQGQLSNGAEFQSMVNIPSPFTYLMMKLTAFGDQADNEKKDFGRHHALDVYRIVAMMNEERYVETKQQFKRYATEVCALRVVSIAREWFISTESPGIVRMKEHAFYDKNLEIDTFIDSLQNLTSI